MAQHFIEDPKAPRLPNGNVHVPPGAIPKRNLSPLSPSGSLTAMQKTWIADTIAQALAPLIKQVAALKVELSGGKPAPAPAGKGKKAAAVTAAIVEPPNPAEEAQKESAPADGAPEFSAPMMAVLAMAKNTSQRKAVVAIFRSDKPEAVKLAEARGLLKKPAIDRVAEALGADTGNADD